MKNILSGLLVLFLVCFVSLVFIGCESGEVVQDQVQDQEDAETETGRPHPLRISSGPSTGVWYPAAVALETLWEGKVDNIDSMALNTPGAYTNLNNVIDGNAEIAFSGPQATGHAYNGNGPYDEPHPDLRVLTGIAESCMQVLVQEEIETVSDLKNTTVAIGTPGSSRRFHTITVLKSFGLEPGVDVNDDPTAGDVVSEGFRDGTISATLAYGIGNPQISELMMTTNGHLLHFTEEDIERMREIDPSLYLSEIPAGTYSGQDEPVPTLFYVEQLVVHKDFPEDLAYELVKAFWENTELLASNAVLFTNVLPEHATKMVSIPLHPGSEKYFKEQGMIN